MAIQSSLFFESPEELYRRVYRELKPRGAAPVVRVEFRQFANADSFARLRDGVLEVRITDVLQGAPAPVMEALAHILLGKLLRKPVAAVYNHRYKLYFNRREIRRSMHLLKQIRGRKFISGPQGEHFNLEQIFEELNLSYFDGLLGRPCLGWSRGRSRTTLGHYDPSHNAIILSRLLDGPAVPKLAVEYVLYHEMLHLRHPVAHSGIRRQVHTREFKDAERAFPRLAEARELLKKL